MKKAIYLILAGMVIGILVAPNKGSETWRKIKDGFDDWKDGAMDQFNDLMSQRKDLVGKGKYALDSANKGARQTVNEW
jgi:gas vesicle protein